MYRRDLSFSVADFRNIKRIWYMVCGCGATVLCHDVYPDGTVGNSGNYKDFESVNDACNYINKVISNGIVPMVVVDYRDGRTVGYNLAKLVSVEKPLGGTLPDRFMVHWEGYNALFIKSFGTYTCLIDYGRYFTVCESEVEDVLRGLFGGRGSRVSLVVDY